MLRLVAKRLHGYRYCAIARPDRRSYDASSYLPSNARPPLCAWVVNSPGARRGFFWHFRIARDERQWIVAFPKIPLLGGAQRDYPRLPWRQVEALRRPFDDVVVVPRHEPGEVEDLLFAAGPGEHVVVG